MIKPLLMAVLSVTLAGNSSSGIADNAEKLSDSFHYDILSKGEDIGDMNIQYHASEKSGYIILENTSLSTSGW